MHMATAVLLSALAVAAGPLTYRWDTSATAGVQGGVGTWGVSEFWTDDDGVTRVAWVDGSIAQFGGEVSTAAGAIGGSGAPIWDSLIFNTPFSGNYTISANMYAVGSATITVNGGSPTISGAINGTVGLRKNGTGLLNLTGANAYSGTNYIDAGSVTLSTSTIGLGQSGNPLVMHSSAVCTLTVSAATSIGSLTGGSNATIAGSSTLTIGSDNSNTTFAGVKTAGGTTKIGTGTLTFTGTNTTTGLLTVSAGLVQLGDGGTTGTMSNVTSVTNNAGVIINLSGPSLHDDIAGTGTLEIKGGGTATLTNTCSNAGGITVAGGTTLVFGDNPSTASGTPGTTPTFAVEGTLEFARFATVTVSGLISGTGSVQVSSGIAAAVLTLTSDNTYAGGTTIDSGASLKLGTASTGTAGSGPIVNDGTLTVTRTSGSYTFSNAVSGSGTVVKTGAGTVIVTAANTYAGTTTSSGGGTLQIGDGGTAGTIGAGAVILATSGTIAFNRSDVVVFSNAVSGSGNISQAGAGTTKLTGTNTQTVATAVTVGTLQVGDSGAAGTLSGNVACAVSSGAFLAWARSDSVSHTSAITGAGTLQQLTSSTLTASSASNTIVNYEARAGTISCAALPTTATANLYVDGDGSSSATNGVMTYTGAVLAVGSKTFNVVSSANLADQASHVIFAIGITATGTPTLKMNGTTRTSGVPFTEPLSGKTVTLTWNAVASGLSLTVAP